MKKITALSLTFILSFITLSCLSQQKIVKEIETQQIVKNEHFPLNNHSFLTEKDVGTSIKITGLLSKNNDKWILTENPKSKSKVSFILDTSEEIKKIFELKKNTLVSVNGKLLKVYSQWTKEIKVESVN